MSRRDHQPGARIMERLALVAVVVFGLGITYAIHITNKTVAAMEKRGSIIQMQTPQASTSTGTPGKNEL